MQVFHEPGWHPSPKRYTWGPPYTPTVYVVGWRAERVVKVGYTMRRGRWTSFLGRGAEVISLNFLEDGDPPGIEMWLQREIGSRHPAAFTRRNEALDMLGRGGDGYLECYRIHPGAWPTLPNGMDF